MSLSYIKRRLGDDLDSSGVKCPGLYLTVACHSLSQCLSEPGVSVCVAPKHKHKVNSELNRLGNHHLTWNPQCILLGWISHAFYAMYMFVYIGNR